MKHDCTDHPKFFALKTALALPRFQVVGLLESLWHLAQKFSPEAGDLSRFSPYEIAAYLEWHDGCDALINTLCSTGWLDRDEATGGLVVHDWEDHRPHYLNDRFRKREEREKLPDDDGQSAIVPDSPGQSRTVPEYPPLNPTLPKYKEKKKNTESSEPKEDLRSEPPVLTIPTVGKEVGEYSIIRAKIDEWQAAYPGVNVETELRKARQWCIDNPTRRKTARGVTRFLSSWLSRAQDSGKGARATPASYISGQDAPPAKPKEGGDDDLHF